MGPLVDWTGSASWYMVTSGLIGLLSVYYASQVVFNARQMTLLEKGLY